MSALDELRENLREAARARHRGQAGAPPPSTARDGLDRACADRRDRRGGRRGPDLGRRAGRPTCAIQSDRYKPPPGTLRPTIVVTADVGRRAAVRPRRLHAPRTASVPGRRLAARLHARAHRAATSSGPTTQNTVGICNEPGRPGLQHVRTTAAARWSTGVAKAAEHAACRSIVDGKRQVARWAGRTASCSSSTASRAQRRSSAISLPLRLTPCRRVGQTRRPEGLVLIKGGGAFALLRTNRCGLCRARSVARGCRERSRQAEAQP